MMSRSGSRELEMLESTGGGLARARVVPDAHTTDDVDLPDASARMCLCKPIFIF